LWQLVGRGERLTDLLRTIAVRLARATGGGVDYWLGLPMQELLMFMLELADQLTKENEALEERAARR
jgi:hypothetical protein